MESLALPEPAFGLLPEAAPGWSWSARLAAAHKTVTGGVSQWATPFELVARQGTGQWSLAGDGFVRKRSGESSSSGAADLLLAYDQGVPLEIGTGSVGVGRLGVSLPTGSAVSAKRALLVGAALAKLGVAPGLAVSPMLILVYDTDVPDPLVSAWSREYRLKLTAELGPCVLAVGGRSAHQRGAPARSTTELGLRYKVREGLVALLEWRRARALASESHTVEAGATWTF